MAARRFLSFSVALLVVLPLLAIGDARRSLIDNPPPNADALLEIASWYSSQSSIFGDGTAEFFASWQQTNPCSSWKGVVCRSGAVHSITINLNATGSTGPIPSAFGKISTLAKLRLRNHGFTGVLPSFIFRLNQLDILDLSQNELEGGIPANVQNLPRMRFLYLQSNMLTGPLPSSLGGLVHMQEFDVSNNKLYGRMPRGLKSWTKLTLFSIANNVFTGPLPVFSSSPHYRVGGNYLTGSPLVGGQTCIYQWSSSAGNCFDSTPGCTSNSDTLQRCSDFCGTGSTAGQCGGGGVCQPGASGSYECVCDSGFSADKGICVKANTPTPSAPAPQGADAPAPALQSKAVPPVAAPSTSPPPAAAIAAAPTPAPAPAPSPSSDSNGALDLSPVQSPDSGF